MGLREKVKLNCIREIVMRLMRLKVILIGIILSATVLAEPLNKIVVFGDSLSDNGNLYEYMKHQLPPSPPYYKGRFTNGLVWVELLTKSFYPMDWHEHLLDYAFGGAGVLGESGDFDDDTLFTLNREIDSYLLAHQNKADFSSLFIVWIGANNYLSPDSDVDEMVADVNWGIKTSLQRLVKHGAKHILVINLPNLGVAPVARALEAEERLTYATTAHNTLLDTNFANLQKEYPDVQWIFFNANQMFEIALSNPLSYGFTNTIDTCYEAITNLRSKKAVIQMVAKMKSNAIKENNACEGYFFFDPVHPTALTHQIMSKQVRELLDKSGVIFN